MPLIDSRSFDDLVAQTERLLQEYSDWHCVAPRPEALLGRVLGEDVLDPDTGETIARSTFLDQALAQRISSIPGLRRVKLAPVPETGWALVRIFARLAEIAIDRLNRAPEKNFLAFLNMIGIDPLPPQAARVPLTFHLAAGSPADALAPARTQVAAAPLAGDTEPVIFETERALVVTRSSLVASLVREPGRDLYGDHTATASGAVDQPCVLFQGDRPIEHLLYLGNDRLFGRPQPKTVTLFLAPADNLLPWPAVVDWYVHDRAGQRGPDLPATWKYRDGEWKVTLADVPAIPTSSIGDHTGAWLCGRLKTPLPRGELVEASAATGQSILKHSNLAPDAGFAGTVALDLSQPWHPFGRTAALSPCALACDVGFGKPGARVTIDVSLDPEWTAQSSDDLLLVWEYRDRDSWQVIGRSSPGSSSTGGSVHDFRDHTRAFTRSGAISFRCPTEWVACAVNGVSHQWLQVRIEQGNYGPPADYHPPCVAHLAVHYEWPLPSIDTIETTVTIYQAGLAPDLVFANQVQADATKDFFPFGEKPRFNDTLYLANEQAFSLPGAAVTLTVTLTNPPGAQGPLPPVAASTDLVLRWEYWDSGLGQWSLLGETGLGATEPQPNDFSDATVGFTQDGGTGKITFACPDGLGATELYGHLAHWLRVRLVQGNYGEDASYKFKDPLHPEQGYVLEEADFTPPSIRSILVDYRYTSPRSPLEHVLTENDFVVEERTQAAAAGEPRFDPFTLTGDLHPTLYLGFQRPGAPTGFANHATALYLRLVEAPYHGATTAAGGRDEPPIVAWEYWNGSHWAYLGTRDETRGCTRRGLVTFVGPADFLASTEFGRPAFWLRARWERGAYASPPYLQRVLTNTTWAINALAVRNEILGSSNGERSQLFTAAKKPILPGQQVEIREPETPTAAERAAIEMEEGDDAIAITADAAGQPAEVWVRWHQVTDFYESTPRSRHYVLDRLAGEIRFGDGQRGLVPPAGRSNVRLAWYQAGGGPQGNRPAGAIAQLKSAVPYIDRVTNVEAAAGGVAAESLEAAQVRGPKTLRHRDRAVALADFEDLARQASNEVARARVITACDDVTAGSVTVIVVPGSLDAKPIPSLELVGGVRDYLEARVTPTIDLDVAGPDWLKVSVSAEIVPMVLEATSDVQAAVLSRVAAFLHPLLGGLDGKGWDFGRQPYRSDLYALIESIAGVDHVRQLSVETEADEGLVHPQRFLVYSGEHSMVMAGDSTP